MSKEHQQQQHLGTCSAESRPISSSLSGLASQLAIVKFLHAIRITSCATTIEFFCNNKQTNKITVLIERKWQDTDLQPREKPPSCKFLRKWEHATRSALTIYTQNHPTHKCRKNHERRERGGGGTRGRGRSEREGEQRRGACCRRTRSNFRIYHVYIYKYLPGNHPLIYHFVSVRSADESAELGSQWLSSIS